MTYRRKYLWGFAPFWPTYRIGYFFGVLAVEIWPALAGGSGRRYLRQYWQEASIFRRVTGIAKQLPRAVVSVLADEAKNIWRSRLNNRVV